MPPAPTTYALVDAWSWASPFRLTGWLERNQFHPLGAALLVLVLAFFLFQGIGLVIMAVGLAVSVAQSGDPQVAVSELDLETLITENGMLLLSGNTVGQWIGFTLFAILVARMSTPEWKEFVRVRRPDGLGFVLAGFGWVVFYPLVLWLGQLNEAIPLPEGIQKWEAQQGDALEMLLLGADLPAWFLFVAVAITPAICEELIFRGYLQRQVERGMGLVWSIVLVGIVFGLYHLQLSKAIPLAALGIYLGFVVWATGSVWTGALVHLLNNGFAVVMVTIARSQPDLDLEAIETMGIPGYLAAASLVLTAAVCYAIYQRRHQIVGDTPDAAPTQDESALPSSLSPVHV
ncbi:MAG: type II CAAX endopeptidase family protein [Bacteroidota bacterium]